MNNEKIGKYIQEKRKEKGLTQEQLAEKLGISTNAVSKWERGMSMPDYSILKSLCNELKITINELLSGENLKKEQYINTAEENFIMLKKKVDKVNRIMFITQLISVIIMIILFILNMYFNYIYKGAWDNTELKNTINIFFYISIAASFISSLLKYDFKK